MTEINVGYGVVSVLAVATIAGLITQVIKFLGKHIVWFPKPEGAVTAYIAYGIAVVLMMMLAYIGYSAVEQQTLVDLIYAAITGLLSGAAAQGGYEIIAKASGTKPEALATKPEGSTLPKPVPSAVAALAVAALSVLTLVTASTENPVSTAIVPDAGQLQATALTSGQTDLFITVPRSNLNAITPEDAKASSPVSVVAALPTGQSVPAAPILGWYNRAFDKGITQRWCLQGDPDVNDVIRNILYDLNAAFPNNFIWIETCDKPNYYGGNGRAAIDCGMQSAVACAVYESDTSGRVSHNPAFTDGRANRIQVLRVAYAHELQHLLDLDHTPCGLNLDPATHLAVASVMTPVDLGRGSSCSDPPALGIEPSDWFWLYDKYNIPRPQPQPPQPVTGTQVATEAWIINNAQQPCPQGTDQWGEYCVQRTNSVTVPTGQQGWIHHVRIEQDGTITWIGDWVFVDANGAATTTTAPGNAP